MSEHLEPFPLPDRSSPGERAYNFSAPTLTHEESAVLLAVERLAMSEGCRPPAYRETLAWLERFKAAGYSHPDHPKEPPCPHSCA